MYNEPDAIDVWDKRFFGIYRGLVIDTLDPEGKSRITLQVPQILGTATTGWAWPINGSTIQQKIPYGSFTNTSSPTSTTTSKVIDLDNTEDNYDIYLSNSSRINFPHSGVYNIQFSAQVYQATNGNPAINFWIKQNGVTITDSAGQVDLSNQNHYALPSWNYLLRVTAGDYVEFFWNSTSSVILQTTSAGAYAPVSPSFAVTASLVGGFTPNPGEGCWVMFEGGDPNFPLWLGAF